MSNRELLDESYLEQILNPCRLVADRTDSWQLLISSNDMYSTSSAYEEISKSFRSAVELHGDVAVFSLLWNQLIPIKVSTLAWRLIWRRLPMTVNLIRRSVQLSNGESRCCFCKSQIESEPHVFITCSFARAIWEGVYKWLKLPMVMHEDPTIHFLSHVGIFHCK